MSREPDQILQRDRCGPRNLEVARNGRYERIIASGLVQLGIEIGSEMKIVNEKGNRNREWDQEQNKNEIRTEIENWPGVAIPTSRVWGRDRMNNETEIEINIIRHKDEEIHSMFILAED
ncbi:hypothetical protein EVAR_102717_1 [Eumeta japonica]|uniref:Uncharacterized protein n=1 Tax=Eumeta variegata TaxID=151549 RepID=A0A4C1THQ4_EUMVA|nr:hypothetical protein EVAR_102717_1 [Eumeta japonica]